MSEFSGPPIGWYDSKDFHEACSCMECHDAGEHNDVEYWAELEGCIGCLVRLQKAIQNKEYCLSHKKWYCEESSSALAN